MVWDCRDLEPGLSKLCCLYWCFSSWTSLLRAFGRRLGALSIGCTWRNKGRVGVRIFRNVIKFFAFYRTKSVFDHEFNGDRD